MRDDRRMRVLALTVSAFFAACGGSGGGSGTPAPAPALPVVDAAVRGTGLSGPRIQIYRDVLHGVGSVAAPDVRISPPANIVFVGFTGTELVLAADFGVANQNRIWVYTQADLAAANPTPSVQCLLPPPAGAVTVSIKDVVVHGGDVYVFSLYLDGGSPFTFTWMTHVFRDVATLLGGAAPDATITHDQVTTAALSAAHETLAVDDDVLLATGRGRLYVSLLPGSLSGAVVPNTSIVLANLSVGSVSRVILGAGNAYLHSTFTVSAFPDPANLSAGQVPDFTLQGPSSLVAGQGAILRLGDRLFSRGPFNTSPISVVGFDVAGAVNDFAPPDVMLGPPVVGDHRLDGAADTLLAASVATGVISVYSRASLLIDGDEPSIYLYDPEILSAAEVRAVER
jgi:hypothetical protein